MKANLFFKIIIFSISFIVTLALIGVPALHAQTVVRVRHDVDIDANYRHLEMRVLATTYFEIIFEIKEGGGEDVEIKLIADKSEGDEYVDSDTYIFYLGDDEFPSDSDDYIDIGTESGDDIQIGNFPVMFLNAFIEDPDWAAYSWDGATIERITIRMEADAITDIVKIKHIRFKNDDGDEHEYSQDFEDYDSLGDADWDNLDTSTGAPIILTSEDVLYIRTIQTAYYEQYGTTVPIDKDKDKDGFSIYDDCDDTDDTVYPGAPGTHKGKDNNCNGIIDEDEKRRMTYPTYSPILPSLIQYQQLWRMSFVPLYLEQQENIWHQYQMILYQHSIQSKVSKGQSWQFYNQPLWNQPYSHHWYKETGMNRPRSLAASLGPTIFFSQSYFPFFDPRNRTIDSPYDIFLGQYLNSIIYNPLILQPQLYTKKNHIVRLFSLTVDPNAIFLTGTGKHQLIVTGYYSDGRIVDLTTDPNTIYISSDPDIATVGNDGIVTAVGFGTATITVTYRGISSQAKISVYLSYIPDVQGEWSGNWKFYKIDPDTGAIETDPNTGQTLYETEGDILFRITSQTIKPDLTPPDMSIQGTVEILNWNVPDFPAWDGEDEEVNLWGWVDEDDQWFKAIYYYYAGEKILINLKGQYQWVFDMTAITDTKVSGSFTIQGTGEYYMYGVFVTAPMHMR